MIDIMDRMFIDPNIELFVTERNILDTIKYNSMQNIQWMKIFNSGIELSNVFIVKYINNIDWQTLTRQLPECIIIRYKRNIVNWTAQLYGQSRTIEFLNEFNDKFDWEYISAHPPSWFTEYHAEIFDKKINWKTHTPFTNGYSLNTISIHSNDLDWDWISANNIRNEKFANRFKMRINWDDEHLDVRNISTEFLYEIHCERMQDYKIANNKNVKPRTNSLGAITCTYTLDNFDPNKKLKIGNFISLIFFRKHIDELDINEIKDRNMFTEEMQTVLDNIDL